MIIRFILMIVGFIVLLGALATVKLSQFKAMGANQFVPPPEAVTTVKAAEEMWQDTLTAIGTIAPVQGVTVSAQQGGQIIAIPVENGSLVTKGDVLIVLDTSVEVARLKAIEARVEYARQQVARYRDLVKNDAVSQSDLDLTEAEFKQLQAQANEIKAVIDQKTVHAPFTGRLGIRNVNVGDYIVPGQGLVPLQKLDSVYFDFDVPQRFLPLLATNQKVHIKVDAYPDQDFIGTITAINPQVSMRTRNGQVQATIPNAEELLRPGMFARVTVNLPKENDVIVIPISAVAYAPYGNSIYLVQPAEEGEGLQAKQVFVQLGPKRGDQVAILSGEVKDGDEVISSGIFKLRNNIAVQVNNTVTPGNDPAPNPANI